MITPEAMPAKSSLPQVVQLSSFGRICSSLAKAMSAHPMALAPPEKQEAFAAISEAFAAMSLAGAPLEEYTYTIHDERPVPDWIDKALAWVGIGDREAKPSNGSMASNSSTWKHRSAELGQAEWMCSGSRGGCHFSPVASSLSHFGDARKAHIFAAAHEFGHAWQNMEGGRHLLMAAQASSGHPFGERMEHLLTPIQGEAPLQIRGASQRAAEVQWISLLCESISDLFGAWALSLAGCPDGLLRGSNWRKSQQEKSPIGYSTFIFLDVFAERHKAMPASFSELALAIEALLQDSAMVKISLDFILAHSNAHASIRVPARPI